MQIRHANRWVDVDGGSSHATFNLPSQPRTRTRGPDAANMNGYDNSGSSNLECWPKWDCALANLAFWTETFMMLNSRGGMGANYHTQIRRKKKKKKRRRPPTTFPTPAGLPRHGCELFVPCLIRWRGIFQQYVTVGLVVESWPPVRAVLLSLLLCSLIKKYWNLKAKCVRVSSI